MEKDLLKTIQNISRKQIINIKNEDYLKELISKEHKNLSNEQIEDFINNNKELQNLLNEYEQEIILNYILYLKKYINEEKYEFLELEEIFRQSVINNLTAIGIKRIPIEKCLEENIDIWFDECINKSFSELFKYDNEDEKYYYHKLYYTKIKKYSYYQKHKDIINAYGTITPEMLMTESEAQELQLKLSEYNQKKLKLN